jgi:polar amino acid transport system substrate-binding protein
MMRIGIGIAPLALAACVATIVVAAPSSPTAHFTADQVSRGRLTYAIQCSLCHGADLGGNYAPALAGSASNIPWLPPGFVYGYSSVYMPAGNAGGLKQQDYVNITAFLMQQNGRHPDSTPLTVQAIQNDQSPMTPTR